MDGFGRLGRELFAVALSRSLAARDLSKCQIWGGQWLVGGRRDSFSPQQHNLFLGLKQLDSLLT